MFFQRVQKLPCTHHKFGQMGGKLRKLLFGQCSPYELMVAAHEVQLNTVEVEIGDNLPEHLHAVMAHRLAESEDHRVEEGTIVAHR